MPKINGLEVARRLIEAKGSTKVVFVTLLAGQEFIDESRRCGHGYVSNMQFHFDLLPAIEDALRDEYFFSGARTDPGR
jgi:DNA-binding NarL/FixJ family response regulator